MPKILVTGCCGFIGSHLTEALLAKKFEVTGIDNFDSFYNRTIKEKNLSAFSNHPNFSFYETDIRHPNFAQPLGLQKFDAIVHLAAKTGIQPSINSVNEYIDTNVTGTANLLNYAKEVGVCKFIFTSSSSVYGNSTPVPFNENASVLQPISPYAFTKLAGEALTYTFHHLHGIDVINLRLFTVYGPRQRPDLAIHKFVRAIYEGRSISLFGNGATARDYTFIQDTVNGYLASVNYLMSNHGVYETINLGSHQPVQLKELINVISAKTGMLPVIENKPMQPGDVNTTYADISKAARLLNYHPTIAISEGVEKFVEWYKTNFR